MSFSDILCVSAIAIVGGGFLLHEHKKQKLLEQEERRRKSCFCTFSDGISKNDYDSIVSKTARQFRRIKLVEIDNAIIHIEYYSQSHISKYYATIDFNDYGSLSGRYWIENDNEDSNLPYAFANRISEALYEAQIIKR